MFRFLCWFNLHNWKDLWIGERQCRRCAKRQFCRSILDKYENITQANPNPHGDFYERMQRKKR